MANLKTTDANLLPEPIKALASFDWGQDAKLLKPIDEAVVEARSDADRKELAASLAAVLATDASRAAKDYVCRKLSLIGSASVVPSLAALLGDEDLSSSARYALERMTCPEASAAMRAALPKTSGQMKAGVANSLGKQRDAASAGALIGLLTDADAAIVGAAAAALGAIGTVEAASALRGFHAKSPANLRVVATDACLECASQLAAAGKKADAMKLYGALGNESQPKYVRDAAQSAMKAAGG
jgi:HEAT repeat protein